MPRPPVRPPESDEAAPFLGSWRRIYAAVLLYLAALIVMFWIFSLAFSPARASAPRASDTCRAGSSA